MLTLIFPSLCQDARVRSKDSFSFLFSPLNIENNLFGPIQEICLSTQDSKDFITEIDDSLV